MQLYVCVDCDGGAAESYGRGFSLGLFGLQEGSTDAQYNSARILRHLAMGGSAAGKQAAYQAIPALVHSLKVQINAFSHTQHS